MRRSVTGLSRMVSTAVGLSVSVVACGARTGLLVPSLDGGLAGEAASCAGTPVAVDPNVPNLYFVLDVSSSMSDLNKWANVRTVVGGLIDQLGPTAAFGAAVFPAQGPMEDVCAVGAEVMSLRLGDTQGAVRSAFLQATAFAPNGGTPTAATIEALAPELASFRGPTFAILATDGGPNCDAALSCDVNTCTSNIDGAPGCPLEGPSCCVPSEAGGRGCLDGAHTIAAVAQLLAMGIQTYVLGIPGSAPYASVLDAVATAGGTARSKEPLYYRADSADLGTLGAAFSEIAARTMASCAFTLGERPSDAGQVNVFLGGDVVHQEGPDGWSLSGERLTLQGASCTSFEQQGSASFVSVTQGCPTVR